MKDEELGKRVKMMLLSETEGGDPRYAPIPSGITGGGELSEPQDLRLCVEGMYETLKTILQRFDENLPWITRASAREGGK